MLPPGQQLDLGPVLAGLGLAWEESAEGDVIRPCLARFHSEVAAGVACNADLGLAPQILARRPDIAIALPQVHAIGPEALCQRDAVVHDESTVTIRANPLERLGKPGCLMLADTLRPELEGCDLAARQSALETLGKAARHVERGDEIKLAGCHAASGNARSGRRKGARRVIGTMRLLAALCAPALLAACAVVPPPTVSTPLPESSQVALGQSVRVGDLVVTPISVAEDSRCPMNARCVWAGRLVVETRIEGEASAGRWRDTAPIQLGETYGTHGKTIALVSGEPGKTADRETRPEDYRFVYEAR